jgi:hypothetical protein
LSILERLERLVCDSDIRLKKRKCPEAEQRKRHGSEQINWPLGIISYI